MSTSLWFLNRFFAPFFCGFCMAAATTVENPLAVAFLVGYAGFFAFLSFELGSWLLARFNRKTA